MNDTARSKEHTIIVTEWILPLAAASTGAVHLHSVKQLQTSLQRLLGLPSFRAVRHVCLSSSNSDVPHAGKKLEKPIEQTITASGLLLLVGTGLVLIVRDTLNLGFLS